VVTGLLYHKKISISFLRVEPSLIFKTRYELELMINELELMINKLEVNWLELVINLNEPSLDMHYSPKLDSFTSIHVLLTK
jgi:hypothetical protein